MFKNNTLLALFAFVIFGPSVEAGVIGPIGGSGLSGEYAQFSDSPFSSVSFQSFYFEDFEDGLFNVLGASASAGGVTSVVFGPLVHDSVDLDDGVLDGSGLAGDSFFSSNGSVGITFSFDALALGALPTHAGIVLTDAIGTSTFEAFDSSGQSLGLISASLADGSFNGTTSDDFFFGATNALGISAFTIRNGGGGIEVDHLQYGLQASTNNPVPEPSSLFLFSLFLAIPLTVRRRHNG